MALDIDRYPDEESLQRVTIGINRYPDEESLQKITDWDFTEQGISGLLDLIKENTNWADRQIHISGKRVIRFEYHTGGWSGNEDVISALQNSLFWHFFWEKSVRGGHYYFRIKLSAFSPKSAKT